MTQGRLPVIFIPHGGGPWHVMPDDAIDPVGYPSLKQWLSGLGRFITPDVKAILVISAHWEEKHVTINFNENPTLLYDYYGFPNYTYSLNWNIKGSSEIATVVENTLAANGFDVDREYQRGLDHGVFVPLMVAFPRPQIPIVQLSLVSSLDPETHTKIGEALQPLRDQGILIIGSGMTYHNMRGFMATGTDAKLHAEKFDEWLVQAMSNPNPYERNVLLASWQNAPWAIECHPRSEHLTPVFVTAGAAGNTKLSEVFSNTLMGMKVSGFIFADS